MILYSEVIKNREKINEKFPRPQRKTRDWRFYPCSEKVLNFGSGNVKNSNHQELKNYYKEVYACDSDESFCADYVDIDDIDKKFGLIIAEHIIEHIKIDEVINKLAKKFHSLLHENAKLIITIPNIHNFGNFFVDFDHKNFTPPTDLAAIFCCFGFELTDYFKWSKPKHMQHHFNLNESEKYLEHFLEKNYGLQLDRYVTLVFEKNG